MGSLSTVSNESDEDTGAEKVVRFVARPFTAALTCGGRSSAIAAFGSVGGATVLAALPTVCLLESVVCVHAT